jgi:SAM-dependent methyltransferase
MEMKDMTISYRNAGIDDVGEFYSRKFVHDASFDFIKIPCNYYNINYFKMLWVFSNVQPNSRVLDFGCGSGTLSCLKAKNCEITGIDFSSIALDMAKNKNSYDHTFCTDISDFDHEKGFFDYIVSLDVLGHIEFGNKDKIISSLKEFLKPTGVMLHGIECGNVAYEEMSESDLVKFVNIDGHIGIENRIQNVQRFEKFFKFVEADLRFDTLTSCDQILKHVEEYDSTAYDKTIVDYIKTFGNDEKTAFDVANGLAMRALNDTRASSNDNNNGFLFLVASDRKVTMNKMACPSNLLEGADMMDIIEDTSVFLKGWYEVEGSDAKWRWGSANSFLRISGRKGCKFSCDLVTGNPLISNGNIMEIYIIDNDTNDLMEKIVLSCGEKKELSFEITSDNKSIRFYSNTTFIPAFSLNNSSDYRELSFMLMNVKIVNDAEKEYQQI